MIITRAQALGSHAYFAAEGTAFANNSNGGGPGTVDVNDAPASNDPAFIPIGTTEVWDDKPKSSDKKVYTPAPAVLVPKRVVTVSQEMMYTFTTNELSPLGLQLFYRATQTLVQASNFFNPLSGKPLHGFLLLQRFSTEGDQVNPYWVALLWVFLKCTGGVQGGDNKIIEPTFEGDQMYSPLNAISMLQQS